MQYSQAKPGRIFVLRLEHGETVHTVIEKFAEEKSITAASVIIVGGAESGSRLVAGPEKRDAAPVVPLVHVLDGVHEICGTGTIFPDENGIPLLHLHMACGRTGSTVTGCAREGVTVWQIMEAVLYELTDTHGIRHFDPGIGFKLLTFPNA